MEINEKMLRLHAVDAPKLLFKRILVPSLSIIGCSFAPQ